MHMTADTWGRLARLARLELSEQELAQMSGELERMRAYLGRLAPERETMSGPGAWGPEPLGPAELRSDCPLPSLEREDLLACAPARDENCYLVPRTVGGGQT